jgi:DNA-binding SARP family transcriptional activator
MLEHVAAHIHLFGGLRLVFPSVTLKEGALATKAAAVIKLLALRPGHTAHRDEVIGTLWADADSKRGPNNLYKALHELRRELPDADIRDVVHIRRKIVSLAPWVEVDLDQFLTQSKVARATKSLEAYDRALSISATQFLPCDIYEDWTTGARDAVTHLDQELRFEAAELCLLNDEAPRAAAHLRALLSADPTNERAHRLLIELYATSGEGANAAGQYEVCITTLDALGLTPSIETTKLYARLMLRPQVI